MLMSCFFGAGTTLELGCVLLDLKQEQIAYILMWYQRQRGAAFAFTLVLIFVFVLVPVLVLVSAFVFVAVLVLSFAFSQRLSNTLPHPPPALAITYLLFRPLGAATAVSHSM